MFEKIIKYCCLFALLLLLFIPALKQHIPLLQKRYSGAKLKGYFPPVDSAHFSIKNWMDGSFQNKIEPFVKRNLKIRPIAVRINNQLHHDLLGENRANKIVNGKDGYLFSEEYIYALQGLDFIGLEKIKTQSKKLRLVSEVLKKENDVDIIVAIALNKAEFLKEKLPPQYDLENLKPTNYQTYLDFFKKNKIKVLDFNQYFLTQKNKTKHHFATKHGVHWSLYGGLVAADSMLSYVGKIKGKKINHLDKSEIIKTTVSRKEDQDIGNLLNLYRPLPTDTFSYFEHYLFPKEKRKPYRPNILLVGDSFSWTIWGQDIPHHYWGDSSLFLYYYNTIWDTKWGPLSNTPLQQKQKLPFAKQSDAIFLLNTPMNMGGFGSGFIEDIFDELGGIYDGKNTTIDSLLVRNMDDDTRLGFEIFGKNKIGNVLLKKEIKTNGNQNYELNLKMNLHQNLKIVLKNENKIIWESILDKNENEFFEKINMGNDVEKVGLQIEVAEENTTNEGSEIYDIFFEKK
ncbi:MAG TPA: hypothetical protein ENJ53_05730 [Phaeodactylibacter sp.]|nr:hypothetical protein [Phaeodactylibacter sp.]